MSFSKTPDTSETQDNGSDVPPEPEFWHYSHCTIEGDDPMVMRSNLFAKLRQHRVEIKNHKTPWRYKLHFTNGPHYIIMDLYFFRKKEDFIIEMNHISGDRWTFWNLWKRLVDEDNVFEYQPPLYRDDTPHYISQRFLDPNYIPDEQVLYNIGMDAAPEWFIPFMLSSDLNVVRIAMERYDGPPTEHIAMWSQKKPQNFLEERIHKRATEICLKE